MHKLFKRITQLNSHARKKLIDLSIYEQTRETWEMAQEQEKNLRSLLLEIPIEVDTVLNSIIDGSRKRFTHGIESTKEPEKLSLSPLRSGRHPTDANITPPRRVTHESGIEHEDQNERTLDSTRIIKERKFITEGDENGKSYAIKHNFQGKIISQTISGEKGDKAVPLIMSMQAIRNEASFSCWFKKDEEVSSNPKFSIIETPKPSYLSKTPTSKTESSQKIDAEPPRTDPKLIGSLKDKLTLSRTLSEGRKARAKSRSDYPKMDLFPSLSLANLPLMRPSARKSIILKKSKTSGEIEIEFPLKDLTPGQQYMELSRNYDLLKLEPFSLPSMSKRLDERKAILERVYNELCFLNQRIKKTVTTYQTEHQAFFTMKSTQNYLANQMDASGNEFQDNQVPSLQFSSGTKPFSLAPISDNRAKGTALSRKNECEIIDNRFMNRKISPPKGQNPNLNQRSGVSREAKTLQISFRPTQEVGGIPKLGSSPSRRNFSPARIAGFSMRQSVTENGQRTKTTSSSVSKDSSLKLKMVKQNSITEQGEKDLMIDGVNSNSKQRVFFPNTTAYPEIYKIPKEPLPPPFGPRQQSPSQSIEMKPKMSNAQTTAAILAKINEEHLLNRELLNKRFY